MSVTRDAPDLRVVLELLLQLLTVVAGLPLSGGHLHDTREDELIRWKNWMKTWKWSGCEMSGSSNRTRQSQVKKRKWKGGFGYCAQEGKIIKRDEQWYKKTSPCPLHKLSPERVYFNYMEENNKTVSLSLFPLSVPHQSLRRILA